MRQVADAPRGKRLRRCRLHANKCKLGRFLDDEVEETVGVVQAGDHLHRILALKVGISIVSIGLSSGTRSNSLSGIHRMAPRVILQAGGVTAAGAELSRIAPCTSQVASSTRASGAVK